MYELMAGKDAAAKAYKEAGITAADIDIAEVHDCFTINQILSTEALGLSQPGNGSMRLAPPAPRCMRWSTSN